MLEKEHARCYIKKFFYNVFVEIRNEGNTSDSIYFYIMNNNHHNHVHKTAFVQVCQLSVQCGYFIHCYENELNEMKNEQRPHREILRCDVYYFKKKSPRLRRADPSRELTFWRTGGQRTTTTRSGVAEPEDLNFLISGRGHKTTIFLLRVSQNVFVCIYRCKLASVYGERACVKKAYANTSTRSLVHTPTGVNEKFYRLIEYNNKATYTVKIKYRVSAHLLNDYNCK